MSDLKPYGEKEYWRFDSAQQSVSFDCRMFRCKTVYDDPEPWTEEHVALNGYKNIDFKGAYLSGSVKFYNLKDQAEELERLSNSVVTWFPYEDNFNFSCQMKIIVLPPLNNVLVMVFQSVTPVTFTVKDASSYGWEIWHELPFELK